MIKSSSFLSVLITALISSAVLAQNAAVKPTCTYEVSLKGELGGMGTRKMQIKGDNFHWDVQSPGMPIQVIKNNDGAFLIPANKRYIAAYPKGSNRERPLVLFPGPIGDVKTFLKSKKAYQAGKEKVGKVVCQIYKYTETESGWPVKLWVNAKTYQPVKLMMLGSKKEEHITATYTAYKVGQPIADSIFKLPTGIPVREMPASLPVSMGGVASSKTETPEAPKSEEKPAE